MNNGVSSFETDVLIFGGGPSGAAVAISLLNQARVNVAIIEQSDLNGRRIGEHVSTGIFEIIKYLKLDPKDFGKDCFLPNYGNTSYWGMDQPVIRDAIFTPEKASYQLDREQFDLTLLKRVADQGGTVFPRTKHTEIVQLNNHSWEVTLKHRTKGIFKINSKFIIDATGRQAHICRQLKVKSKKYDKMAAVGAFLISGSKRILPHEILLETVENGWWYYATLKNNGVTTIFFSDADIISKNELNKTENWSRLLNETKQIKKRIKGFISDESGLWVRNAFTQITDITSSRNFLAVGDAAASFDPISSMGIGFALTSAFAAAKVVINTLSIKNQEQITGFQKDIENNFGNYLQLRTQIYNQEKRWPTSDFWKRRQS